MPLPQVRRIPIKANDVAEALLNKGWREVEILETFETRVWGEEEMCGVRQAVPADLPAVEKIAGSIFEYDRLHADPLVGKEEADAAKASFVRSAFERRVDDVLVHGEPIDGFLVMRYSDDAAIVDLIGVTKGARGLNVARNLIISALARRWPKIIRAGTQSTNKPAKRLYEKLGMRVVKRERTFHK